MLGFANTKVFRMDTEEKEKRVVEEEIVFDPITSYMLSKTSGEDATCLPIAFNPSSGSGGLEKRQKTHATKSAARK